MIEEDSNKLSLISVLNKDSNIANNIFQFFNTKEASQLRLVSKDIEETIKIIEFNDVETRIKGKFSDWFECFPKAIGGYFDSTSYISKFDVQNLTKIRNIDGTFHSMLKVLALIEIYKCVKIDISI
jgi:hypothetical protein